MVDGLPFSAEGYERAKNILASTYGKPSEVVNAHVQEIMNLRSVYGSNPVKIYQFYEKLLRHVQSLDTMGKLNNINGYVSATIDRLSGIRSDLVRLDDTWQEWGFQELVTALRRWTERNPVTATKLNNQIKREKSFKTNQVYSSIMKCVFCDGDDHKSGDCTKIKTVEERKIIREKRLCFNCAKSDHRTGECKSKNCYHCGKKHYSTVCNKKYPETKNKKAMCSTDDQSVVYPVVVVEVNGVQCRALIDTGAGSSYASSTLLKKTKLKPIRRERKKIEMLMHTATEKLEVYQANIGNLEGTFELCTEVTKVDKNVLMNPQYKKLIAKYAHLKDVNMDDHDPKEELPVHVVLGANEFSKIKMKEVPRVGMAGEPVAELTRFGWMIISPGNEIQQNAYLTRSCQLDYEQLC